MAAPQRTPPAPVSQKTSISVSKCYDQPIKWIDTNRQLPEMEKPGYPSKLLLADYGEDCSPRYSFLRYWKSSLAKTGSWFLDTETFFMFPPNTKTTPPLRWCYIDINS